ncbi:hypothetical protein T10_487 [Trichinella papuae]|uniref:Uncharacterized protein n=1 Tax=Trichinella papuae TaxID=268474 RepID=A0A0V1M1U3_9BILA|nr:hypothetical protein T10_487 [Trichinella papuae]
MKEKNFSLLENSTQKYFIVIGGGNVRLFVFHCGLIWQFEHRSEMEELKMQFCRFPVGGCSRFDSGKSMKSSGHSPSLDFIAILRYELQCQIAGSSSNGTNLLKGLKAICIQFRLERNNISKPNHTGEVSVSDWFCYQAVNHVGDLRQIRFSMLLRLHTFSTFTNVKVRCLEDPEMEEYVDELEGLAESLSDDEHVEKEDMFNECQY